MSVLKGNYQAKVIEPKQEEKTTEQKFEAEAMKKLGGSICFVSKQKVNWNV